MKSRSSLLGSLIAGCFLGCCLIVVLAGVLVLGVQKRAVQLFGEPVAGLSGYQRFYLSLQLLLQEKELTQPRDPDGLVRPFEIELGENTSALIERLEAEKLISSAGALRSFLIYRGMDTTLQAGTYELSPAMNAVQLAHALQDATPTRVSLMILAGWRLEEIAQALPTSGIEIPPDEFLAYAYRHPEGYSFSNSLPDHASLEGFFFPGQYEFRRDVSVDQFFRTILDTFEANLTPDIQQGFNRQNLDIFHGVTLASIVEREAVIDDEMPMIASVFLNRLAANMNLDSDPTAQYAIGYNPSQGTWWTNPLSLDDLAVDSPYNTYRNPGLPPGPIANPGLAALRAVAFPAQTPYYYFRAACDGSGKHVFAVTFDEHVGNACP